MRTLADDYEMAKEIREYFHDKPRELNGFVAAMEDEKGYH